VKLIKRYRNRRLYDTELRKVINLTDIKSYVLNGRDLKVIDNATGKDITITVLATVLGNAKIDFKKTGPKIITLIMHKGGIGFMDIFKKLTLASIGALNLTREKTEELFDELVKKGEMSEDERSQAVKNFVDRTVESSEKARKWAEDTFKNMSTKFLSRFDEQIVRLSDRLEQLNVRLGELEKKVGRDSR